MLSPNKKNIILTISVGMIARNILHNKFWELLRKKYNVIILTSFKNDDKADFEKQFGGEGVVLEELVLHNLSRFEKIFWSLHKSLMYNPTTKLRAYYGLTSEESLQKKGILKRIKNFVESIIFGGILSKFHFLKDFLKFVDRLLFRTDYYASLFEKYKPVAVFGTNIASDDETYLIRSAKRHGIFTFGMTKSWDNFSKIGFREKADMLIVWSDFMRDEALAFQHYRNDQIKVIGIPQFDLYYEAKDKYTKEDFTKLYGLDPNKKIILFGDGGIKLSPDDPYVISVIADWIKKNNKPYQILVRPHYMWAGAYEHFKTVEDKKIVFIDTFNKPSSFKRGGGWDISPEHHLRLVLSMRWSDLVVTSISTLVLDALASGNKVICYAFDKDKNTPYTLSIKRLYTTLWFLDLEKYGLKKYKVYSEDELTSRIEALLSGYSKPESPERIISRFCFKVDGKTGERLFNIVDSKIGNLTN